MSIGASLGLIVTILWFANFWSYMKIPRYVVYGRWAILSAVNTVMDITGHESHFWTGVSAATTAAYAWLWWNGGGGDNTKRRFREFKRKFSGVRRTAPNMA